MRTKIKICGIKTIDEVEIINKYLVNYIGFIFAKSKRQINVEQANLLKKHLRDDIKTVGVFVDEDIEIVNNIISKCDLEVVQLHGDESVDYCKDIKAKVWKTISIKDACDIDQIYKYDADVDGVLLDTNHKGQKGGTGVTFDWLAISKGLQNKKLKCKLIIAGGLSAENAAAVIEIFQPDVLDFNSKLETNLIKDDSKINKLFERLQN